MSFKGTTVIDNTIVTAAREARKRAYTRGSPSASPPQSLPALSDSDRSDMVTIRDVAAPSPSPAHSPPLSPLSDVDPESMLPRRDLHSIPPGAVILGPSIPMTPPGKVTKDDDEAIPPPTTTVVESSVPEGSKDVVPGDGNDMTGTTGDIESTTTDAPPQPSVTLKKPDGPAAPTRPKRKAASKPEKPE